MVLEFAKLFLKVRNIDSLPTCREEIASALNDFGNRWCKREGVEDNALKEWKRSIFTIVDKHIKFYSPLILMFYLLNPNRHSGIEAGYPRIS